jgi:hypothetical protein
MKFKPIYLVVAILFFNINIFAQQQKEIKLKSFSKVKFEGSATWVLIQSDEEKIIIESESSDVFGFIKIKQQVELLTISTTDKNKDITKLFKKVTIKVYFKSINDVALSGIGMVKTEDKIGEDKFTATLRGTGNMDLDIECKEFHGNMFGTGSLKIYGNSDKSTVKVEGVGAFNAYDFITENTTVTVSGVGGAQVNATKILYATINGIGSIRYKSEPDTKKFNTNGIGSIKQRSE